MTETDTIVILANELRELGAEVIVLTGDLNDPNSPKLLIERTVDEVGGLDAVVSNAGITNPAALKDLKIDQWDKLIAINTRTSGI
jgi:glucose 1-dehydrogenase